MTIQNNFPLGYGSNTLVGLQLAWGSNTTLTVAAGYARDSATTQGVANVSLTSSVTINAAVNGINGLDTGSLANSTVYAVYVIGRSLNNDPTVVTQYPTGAIVSTNLAGAPLLPSGYDIAYLVGYAMTDGSAHFKKFYVVGNGRERTYYWDTVFSVLSGGTATTLTSVELTGAVPPVANLPVLLTVEYTPATAGDKVSIATYGSTATTLAHVNGTVAAKASTGCVELMSALDATPAATILYINSAASGSTNIWVNAFRYFI